jgi:D-alanyl-D-alanine carboxypeptidase
MPSLIVLRHLRSRVNRLFLISILLPSVSIFGFSASSAQATELSPQIAATPSIDQADSLWVVVNKQRPLNPANYVPENLVLPKLTKGNTNPHGMRLRQEAADALAQMAVAMKAAGAGSIVLQSGYRGYSSQRYVHNHMVLKFGLAKGESYAARPGYSEHQTGLAADLAAVGQGCIALVCFSKTKAAIWLAANSWQYGFLLRYPKYGRVVTGYNYEPWHFRFVGLELSTKMHDDGKHTLEQEFGLPHASGY